MPLNQHSFHFQSLHLIHLILSDEAKVTDRMHKLIEKVPYCVTIIRRVQYWSQENILALGIEQRKYDLSANVLTFHGF